MHLFNTLLYAHLLDLFQNMHSCSCTINQEKTHGNYFIQLLVLNFSCNCKINVFVCSLNLPVLFHLQVR
ncbi:hypothetical protein CICLE_v10010848mg [Citrus x clementina]|uniref:Uncharacterized protein n=1 Tax=Citrus clementina TaxID=85681 RepID=V4TY74_CITCL|nr:hypothetical protein CICLE_v10010848mg [Citrus x clementina]